jgi:hypothetical protein
MAELKVPQFPVEMAHEQVIKAMGARDATILQTFVDEFGSEKVQKMVYPRLKELGKQMAAMAPQMGITGKDAIAIASMVHIFEKQMMRIEGEPTEVSSDRVVKKITKCPLQDSPLDYCLSYQGITDGIAEGINPEYKFTTTKIIPKGDPVCEWIIQKK